MFLTFPTFLAILTIVVMIMVVHEHPANPFVAPNPTPRVVPSSSTRILFTDSRPNRDANG